MAIVELAIDFGSSYITIYQKGKGVVLKEPSVAIAVKKKNKLELAETGRDALNVLYGSLGNAQVVYPIKEGVVVHQEAAGMMLKSFIKKVVPDRLFITPTVKALVLISCGLTVVERRTVESVVNAAGIKEVMLAESALALLQYTNSVGGVFVDIGGGTAEVCSVTRRGIAVGSSVNIGGNMFNSKIIDHVADKYGLKIGDYTAEKLKCDVGSMYDNDLSGAAIGGRDRLNGEPKTVEANAKDVKIALMPAVDGLVDVINNVINMSPPELAAEIKKKGVFLSGGSAKLPGLAEYISVRIGLPVTALTDLTEAVALGGGSLIEEDGENTLRTMLGLSKNV